MPIRISRGVHAQIAVEKAAGQLQDKAAVGYVYDPGGSILCKECAFTNASGLCTDHPGREQHVDLEEGSCNDWQDLRKGRVAGNNSRRWVDVAYMTNRVGFGCRRCVHMGYPAHDCDAVDKDSPGATPGEIHPYGCCTLWKKDGTRGDWTEARFH